MRHDVMCHPLPLPFRLGLQITTLSKLVRETRTSHDETSHDEQNK